ncbi:MAG: hypothetical protein EHM40_04795 [Chloroflexi bacterium]|nr:MAG: hypothetical protein EHM40_04795 [Chloroflexota bacterium]
MFRNKFLGMVLLMGMLISQSVPKALAATYCDHAQFVSDLTAPDGSAFAPGAAFTKTWRVMNAGTCTWTTSYNLVWVGGDVLGAPLSVRLPVEVAPGQMVDVSVNLTAPTTSGHYKGLFKISNAAGTQFGIGDSAGDPFWADINVVSVEAVIYDFVANAPFAQWKSGAGILPFPGTSGDSRGYSYQMNNPHLENDSYDAAAGLLVIPQNKFNGYIQAMYPEFQIQPGDRLQTLVNCEFGASGCYVTFRIDYLLPNGVQKTLWTWKEAYDKRFYRANLDLSSLAGQKVRFVFMLLSSGFASGDRAIWGSPRIVRTGTGQPPAPPPTLTPLPPLPATATPLGQPPPTVAPAGCDRGTFVTDVTVQDGTVFVPGATFTKTWRLKNSGACVWTTAYKLVYYSGEPMSTSTMVNLPWGAVYGQTVDISVNMVAPATAGKYRGYWILANASGQFFGIGTNASNPIWVEINVSGDPTFEGGYPFWLNACSAEWRSGAGPLPCPGTEGDRKGFIIPLGYSHLEDGNKGPAPTILMSPENKYNGYIQGIFPTFTVQPGDHFFTVTGCEYGYNCYVTFRLDYMTANGGIFNFWSWREQNDKKNHMASVDLTPLAGRSVRFILTILATGSATGDRVRWGGPMIIRAEAPQSPTLTPSPTATQTPTPPTVVPPPVVSSPLIKKLFMNDLSNGWSLGNNFVLRTADGGTHWHNVTAPNISAVINGFFQSPSKGWVLARGLESPDTSSIWLLRTTDGGYTWTTYRNLPFDNGSIQFLDDMNGFVMAGLPSGMHKHAVQIYRTSDGGATWTLKYAVDPSQPVNTLPFGGVKYGIAFRDPSTGWVGGYSPATGTVYLYKTTDGGVTWAPQSLALPAGYETADFSTTAPTFFGPNDAVLPVWLSTSAGRDLYIYATHDGGATWSRSANFARNGASVAFASWKDVFGYDLSDVFHVTNDAGATWRTVTPNVRFSELAYQFLGMDFVSPTAGWILIENESRTTSLYRTNDGGSSWTLLSSGAPTPTPTPFIGTVTVQSVDIQIVEAQPLQANAVVRGTLSDTGCTTIAGINQLLDGNTFRITVMLNTDSAVQCTNTPTPFERVIPLYTNNLPPGRYTVSAHGVEKSFEFLTQDFTKFGQTLVETLNAHNFATADVLMDQSFMIALWQSQGTSYTPDLAIEQLQTNYLGAGTVLAADPNKDLNTLLNGSNPYSIVGLDPSNSQALFVSGWGLDGKDEAILYTTRLADGSLYWHSVLIAKGGFASDPGPISHEAFCADTRIPILIEQLKGSMNQSNGDMFAALVSPLHGTDVRLWAYETPVNFTTATARDIFTSTEVYRWGSGPAGGTEYGTGTFSEIIQPKMLEVLNAPNMETYCDELTKVFPLGTPWPYPDIHYYNLYKPASSEVFDFRTWLIGFEYVNNQPYLRGMVTIVWEP